jgi:peptidoglycan-associated lipoprotein
MKLLTNVCWLVVAVLISASVVGCKRNPGRITQIPGSHPGTVGDSAGTPLDTNPLASGTGTDSTVDSATGGLDASKLPLHQWTPSAEQPFTTDTVYFDFDKSNIKPSEVPKIEKVASAMKNYSGKALRIEGHCDERGTEEYNRALGERRALSVREYLVQQGVSAQLIDTISFGEDRPVVQGHTPEAWAKNRRGEFILLDPPK